MAFRSVNLNQPRGSRGGGGGRGGGHYRGGPNGGNSAPVRLNASELVDQGFGPVGGASAADDLDIDIFGIDDPSTFQAQAQQPPPTQPIFNNPSRGRGRGRGGYHNANQRDGFQFQGGNNMSDGGLEVQIRGWDGAENRNDVIAFLLRKFGVQVQNYRFQGEFLFCSAPNQAAYSTLLNASGVRFAGKSLQIQPSQGRSGFGGSQDQGPGLSHHAQTTYEILKEFLSRRYNTDSGLLDLSNLAADGMLQNSGFFNNPSTQAKLFPALMKIANENIPKQGVGVVSVSLAENGLRDVRGVDALAATFPDLKNLSLQQNNITRWSDLEPWSHANKFSQLETLLLVDNPIQRNARDPTEYQNEVSKRFPSLKWLDGSAIVKIVFDVPVDSSTQPSTDIKVELPGKVQQGAWAEGSKDIGVGFLGVFFSLYDTDRQNLVQQYYTPSSLFSLSVDTTTPHQPTHQRRNAIPGTPQTSNMSSYIPQSRNLVRTNNPNARRTRLHHGRDQIAQAFNNLPRTRHPIEDAAAFVADGFQVQISSAGGIMVSVHGEFLEVTDRGTEIRRSFDRTFLLGPPVPTNPGSQCVVVSDLLVLRPWSGRNAWIPEQGVDAQGLVQEVRRRTGLNKQYAEMLLRECNGDVEAAVRRFEEAKSLNTIPPEAF